MKVYEIDGAHFATLDEFFDEVSRVILPSVHWGRNLNAFNDILRGGFGTPDEGFTIRWVNSNISRQRLGHEATARQLKLTRPPADPHWILIRQQEIAAAESGEGPTIFDWLVEIIERHGHGGDEAESNVQLRFE